ncbi:hypothetical protein, partial [Streptomyces sp900116325]|uniref:hypothetical protein n=1 Tax=Streptomyces sp. 900116325 TaxID=3154295 RepID=UPI0033A64B5D
GPSACRRTPTQQLATFIGYGAQRLRCHHRAGGAQSQLGIERNRDVGEAPGNRRIAPPRVHNSDPDLK